MKYGVEFEVYNFNPSLKRAAEKIGIQMVTEDHNHATKPWWKVTTDASIRRTTKDCPDILGARFNNPVEIVSPPLENISGIKILDSMCNLFVDHGLMVNRSCGLHVHVDVSSFTPQQILFIAEQFWGNIGAINQLIPEHRRRSHYCQDSWCGQTSFAEVKSLSMPYIVSRQAVRHAKLNLYPVVRQNTIEFRLHEGTILASKVIPWVLFCLNFTSRMAKEGETWLKSANEVQIPDPKKAERLKQKLWGLVKTPQIYSSTMQKKYLPIIKDVYLPCGNFSELSELSELFHLTLTDFDKRWAQYLQTPKASLLLGTSLVGTSLGKKMPILNPFVGLPAVVVSYLQDRTALFASGARPISS